MEIAPRSYTFSPEDSHQSLIQSLSPSIEPSNTVSPVMCMYVFGLFIVLLGIGFQYWQSHSTVIPPKEETNLTILYAIEKLKM